MQLELKVSSDTNVLIPILHDAEEDDARIERAINETENTGYLAFADGECVGGALMRWQTDESEIIYIAIRDADRGKGYGKAFIAELVTIAKQHPTQALIVGTASTSVDNIIFYQKCGFRMDTVRKDYFSYFHTPVYEHGILMRDMLMLRYKLTS